ALRDYLALRLHLPVLDYAQRPQEMADGCETYTYHFQLQKAPGLPPGFHRPLVLRIYGSPAGRGRVAHEFEVQRHLVRLGYPVPRPILSEKDSSLFGGPFLLLQKVQGRTWFDGVLCRPWQILSEPWRMAALHARLHSLPAEDFPAPPGPFLARRLDQLEDAMRQFDLAGL